MYLNFLFRKRPLSTTHYDKPYPKKVLAQEPVVSSKLTKKECANIVELKILTGSSRPQNCRPALNQGCLFCRIGTSIFYSQTGEPNIFKGTLLPD